MQLVSSSEEPSDEDLEPDSFSLTIVPTASASPAVASDRDTAEEKPEQTPVSAMFVALSNCSNLHPDPVDPNDEEEGSSRLFQAGLAFPGAADGGLPPAMPGSGGWITAENMHEFVDENGNWVGDEEEEGEEQRGEGDEALGPGAGNVRSRDDADQDEDGSNEPADETKWRRTS